MQYSVIRQCYIHAQFTTLEQSNQTKRYYEMKNETIRSVIDKMPFKMKLNILK